MSLDEILRRADHTCSTLISARRCHVYVSGEPRDTCLVAEARRAEDRALQTGKRTPATEHAIANMCIACRALWHLQRGAGLLRVMASAEAIARHPIATDEVSTPEG